MNVIICRHQLEGEESNNNWHSGATTHTIAIGCPFQKFYNNQQQSNIGGVALAGMSGNRKLVCADTQWKLASDLTFSIPTAN